MAKKTPRRAAGKKPAASKPRKAAEKKARPSKSPTPPGSGKRRRERKQGRDPSKFRDQKRTPANPGKTREIGKRAAARAAKAAAGNATPAAKLDRPSPVDIPLGKDATAFVRFDTPKSIATKGAIEKLMEKKAKGDDAKHFSTFKWACHYLLRVGLEVATSENKWPATAEPKDVDLANAIDLWAAKKWPDAEDRPKTKALIFQLLAIAVETTTHTPKKKPTA